MTLSDASVVVTALGTSSSIYVHHCTMIAQIFKVINMGFHPWECASYYFEKKKIIGAIT